MTRARHDGEPEAILAAKQANCEAFPARRVGVRLDRSARLSIVALKPIPKYVFPRKNPQFAVLLAANPTAVHGIDDRLPRNSKHLHGFTDGH